MQAIVAASDEHIQTFLIQHSQWQVSHGCLKRGFQFADFVEAFGFMSKVALLAERANHHPQWSNVYRSVEIELITHEVQGISQRDFDLAMAIDHLL